MVWWTLANLNRWLVELPWINHLTCCAAVSQILIWLLYILCSVVRVQVTAMGTCILLERLWIDRNKHRLANKNEICRALWYPSLSYARRSIVLRLPVQENPVVRVTPTDSLWISAKPWNEQIKSSIFRRANQEFTALGSARRNHKCKRTQEYNASSLLEV